MDCVLSLWLSFKKIVMITGLEHILLNLSQITFCENNRLHFIPSNHIMPTYLLIIPYALAVALFFVFCLFF